MGFKFYIKGGPSNTMKFFVKFQSSFPSLYELFGEEETKDPVKSPQLSMKHSTIIQLHQITKRK